MSRDVVPPRSLLSAQAVVIPLYRLNFYRRSSEGAEELVRRESFEADDEAASIHVDEAFRDQIEACDCVVLLGEADMIVREKGFPSP